MNQARLKAFQKTRLPGFSLNTTTAQQQHSDTLLFHGCSLDAATNIQAEPAPQIRREERQQRMVYVHVHVACARGTRARARGGGGGGLYRGRPLPADPRKAVTYCRGSPLGDFIFACRFNPSTTSSSSSTSRGTASATREIR